jgi:3-oxoacyl-[acyl-carrier protein] reductase
MNSLLKEQIAIVTGGSAGIGKAIAIKFAAEGATVIIFGSNAERGTDALKEIKAANNESTIEFVQVDVSDGESVAAAVKRVIDTYGKVDILVNNAGITRDQLLMKMNDADWDSVMNVNLKSCFYTCRSVVRAMMKARKGKIINISSVVGVSGNAGQANYAASKAGMIGFTKSLAKELASRKICVNCVAPGFITTQMTDVLTEEQRTSVLDKIPLGRMGQSSEIADAVLFLASHMSDYITGQTLAVDGGMLT